MTVCIRALGQPGDLGWVVMAHGEMYAAEYGWDTTFEELVTRIVADYATSRDPAREAAWIADTGTGRAGCIFCIAKDAQTAQLRLLLVDPAARGRGVGSKLVAECIGFARAAGYRQMVLWTDHPPTGAAPPARAHGIGPATMLTWMPATSPLELPAIA